MIGRICFAVVVFVFSGLSHAMEDHSLLMEKAHGSARDITRQCLECHAAQGEDFVKTAHWLWKGGTAFLEGRERGAQLGKINLMNDY